LLLRIAAHDDDDDEEEEEEEEDGNVAEAGSDGTMEVST
jgi:hypothetical protein